MKNPSPDTRRVHITLSSSTSHQLGQLKAWTGTATLSDLIELLADEKFNQLANANEPRSS